MSLSLSARVRSRLAALEEQGLRRRLVEVSHLEGPWIRARGRRALNLSSNDYLGLAADQDLLAAFLRERSPLPPPGAAASRLMTGNSPEYRRLEGLLARLYRREAALVFGSGYHANIGIIPALLGRGDLIVADRLCHASLIDGFRLSRARLLRFAHNDVDEAAALLARHRSSHGLAMVVSESVFSMDGDRADIPALVALCRRHGAALYLDEAHAVGVFGERGLGLAEAQGLVDQVDFLVGTFGKALGSQGAFVVCGRAEAELLCSAMRSLVFTTGLPPLSLAWTTWVLERLPGMGQRRARLHALARDLRKRLAAAGLHPGGESQILPLVVGEAQRCLDLAEQARDAGLWVHPVRPPTVPRGTARFRLSLRADMEQADLDLAATVLIRILGGESG